VIQEGESTTMAIIPRIFALNLRSRAKTSAAALTLLMSHAADLRYMLSNARSRHVRTSESRTILDILPYRYSGSRRRPQPRRSQQLKWLSEDASGSVC
jgi:hypothetical protein